MPFAARQWPWLIAVALATAGCAALDVGDEPEIETAARRSDRKSANEPASLSNEPAADGRRDDDEAATVHVSDAPAVVKSPLNAPPEYGAASGTARGGEAPDGGVPAAPSNDAIRDPATAILAVPRPAAADAEHVAAFDQLMAEARRQGTLSAVEEAAFRRDLAAMPAELRPQMAAMLLAMRNRQSEPTVAQATMKAAALRPVDATSDRALAGAFTSESSSASSSASPSPALTTAQRLARIASPAAADPLADNPLRALADAAHSDVPNALQAPTRAVGQPLSAGRPTRPNAPAEIIPAELAAVGKTSPRVPSDASHPSSLTTWPDAHAAADHDAAAVDREIQSALYREAAAARQTHRELPSEEWQVMLGATIRALEAKLADAPQSDDELRQESLLRLLYLVAGRLDDAARPVPADKREQQFWIDWLYGTSVYLDYTSTTNDGQRAAVAADRLREAVDQLGQQANLVVSNLAFCRRVTSFGVYEPFTAAGAKSAAAATLRQTPQYEFTPNQEVLLYAEVRNFTSVHTENGYHTLLRPSYQIFDAQGRRLGSVVELDESHDYCRRPRADFFVCYHIYLPTRIDPGAYKLKLTIEDVHGRKVHENSIDFSIKAR